MAGFLYEILYIMLGHNRLIHMTCT